MDFLVELIFNVLFEVILEGWVALGQWIVPEKSLSLKARSVIKGIAAVVSMLCFLSIFIGGIMWLADDAPLERTVAKYMVLIPLILGGAQILLGVLVRIREKRT